MRSNWQGLRIRFAWVTWAEVHQWWWIFGYCAKWSPLGRHKFIVNRRLRLSHAPGSPGAVIRSRRKTSAAIDHKTCETLCNPQQHKQEKYNTLWRQHRRGGGLLRPPTQTLTIDGTRTMLRVEFHSATAEFNVGITHYSRCPECVGPPWVALVDFTFIHNFAEPSLGQGEVFLGEFRR